MATGPGKYDDLCTYVREKSGATMVLLIIGGGNKGPGFSAQFAAPPGATSFNPRATAMMNAAILRDVATQLERDAEQLSESVGAYVSEEVRVTPQEAERLTTCDHVWTDCWHMGFVIGRDCSKCGAHELMDKAWCDQRMAEAARAE